MTNKNITLWIVGVLVVIGAAILLFTNTIPKNPDTTASIVDTSQPLATPSTSTPSGMIASEVVSTEVINTVYPSLPQTGFPPRD